MASNPEIENSTFDGIVQSVGNFRKLENIKLIFNSCSRIDNESLRILSLSLKTLIMARRLDLSFDNCNQIGTEGISVLSLRLKFLS